jgi:hypothetical protein
MRRSANSLAQERRRSMKSNLVALAVAALFGGILILPLTHQSAAAQIHAGLKGLGSNGGTLNTGTPMTGTNNDRGEVILVGRGGRGGGGHGGGRGGGRSFGGGHHGGGGKAISGGGYRGGGKAYRGGGHRSYAYRGGGSHGYKSRGYQGRHYANRDGRNKHYSRSYNKGHSKYYRYGRYYGSYGWYGPIVGYGYGYGNCAWLRQQALITGSPYWWDRYYSCIDYY